MPYYIYKYLQDNNNIIYIGKTKRPIIERVYEHSKEDKFSPYLLNTKIFYTICKNEKEMDLLETALINQFHPCLNIANNNINLNISVNTDLIWEEYVEQLANNNNNKINLKLKQFLIKHFDVENYLSIPAEERVNWFNNLSELRLIYCSLYKLQKDYQFYISDIYASDYNRCHRPSIDPWSFAASTLNNKKSILENILNDFNITEIEYNNLFPNTKINLPTKKEYVLFYKYKNVYKPTNLMMTYLLNNGHESQACYTLVTHNKIYILQELMDSNEHGFADINLNQFYELLKQE